MGKHRQVTFFIPLLLAVLVLANAFTAFASPVRDLPGQKKKSANNASNKEKIIPRDLSADQVPRIVKKRVPHYPPEARRANIKGKVILKITTDIYGRVVNCKIVAGHPLLRMSAAQSVRYWLYAPYKIEGKPHPVRFNQVISFGTNAKKR